MPDKVRNRRPSSIEAIIWLLRCYHCRSEFEVLRPPTAEVMAAAMESECPHCSAKPPLFDLATRNGRKDMRPHDIVGLKDK